MHNFIKVSSMMPKFRKKIKVEFQENAWTDGRMEGGTAMGQIRKKKKLIKEFIAFLCSYKSHSEDS